MKGFATIAEPLTKLTQKNVKFQWSQETQDAFDKLKFALHEATSLAFPHPNLPCIVESDSSNVAVGRGRAPHCVLLQDYEPDTEKLLPYPSRTASGHCRVATLPTLLVGQLGRVTHRPSQSKVAKFVSAP